MKFRRWPGACLLVLLLGGCSAMQPMGTVEEVDLERFMGVWYVIANIPTPLEKGAHNAIENYRLNGDGTIATTFTFRDGAFDGKRKAYHPKGIVSHESNAIWGMQFVWPFKADYRIIYLDGDYSTTIIGRQKRDYIWIMSRTPEVSTARYAELLKVAESAGYDTTSIEQVPQSW